MSGLLGGLLSIGSALIGGIASNKAAKTQASAADNAAKVQRQNFLDSTALLKPAIDAGNTARQYQLGALGLPGGVGGPDAFMASPGYDWRLSQGVNAVDQSAAMRGQLGSGATLKALTQYGQNIGSQEFGSWYDRLAGLSGSGNNATGTQINLGAGTANNLADLALQKGDARASSYINGANSIIGAGQNLANLGAYYNWQLPQVGGPIVSGGAFY